jgi:phosphoesterase RecJ-like protein
MPILKTLNDLRQVFEAALNRYDDIGIITHVNPDGDGFCAALALQEYLRYRSKHAEIILEDEISEQYDFLQGRKRSISYHQGLSYKLIFILDAHESRRVGICRALLDSATEIIIIDHHELAEEIAGAHLYIDATQVSVGALLFDLLHKEIEAMPAELAQYIATCVYTSILNDTDNFINANVTAEVFATAARLMHLGINPGEVVEKFFHNRRAEEMRFVGEVLSTIETRDDDAVLFMNSTQEMLDRNHLDDNATSKMTRWVKGLHRVKVIVYFREIAPQSFRLSLRSNEVNVNAIAVKYDGGGHIKASGCSMTGTLEEIKATILDEIRLQLS